jgi:hypothetical protein
LNQNQVRVLELVPEPELEFVPLSQVHFAFKFFFLKLKNYLEPLRK